MNLKTSVYNLIVLPFVLLFSIQAAANAGWPGAWVLALTAEAYKNFFILVVLSLIVEAFFVLRSSDLNLWKSFALTLIANLGSAVVGFGLGVAFLYTDYLFEKMGAGGHLILGIDLVIIFIVSVMVEVGIVRLFWKAPWKKMLPIMSISNAITHGLGIFYFFTNIR